MNTHTQTTWEPKSALRYLLAYGGVSVNPSVEIIGHIERIFDQFEAHQCVVCWEEINRKIGDAFFHAPPNHPAVADLVANLHMHSDLDDFTDYLTKCWANDERVVKLPPQTFYPFRADEPWKFNRDPGPDTYGIMRWPSYRGGFHGTHQLKATLGVMIVVVGDCPTRKTLALESHMQQTVSISQIAYGEPCNTLDLERQILHQLPKFRRLGCERILVVPSDHVLDRRMFECHAGFGNVIAVSGVRLWSAEKMFSMGVFENKADYPYEVFERHGARMSKTGYRPWERCWSFPVSRADIKDIDPAFNPTVRALAMSTKLCEHPVNERVDVK